MKTAEQMKRYYDEMQAEEKAKLHEKIGQMPKQIAETAIEKLDANIKELGYKIVYQDFYKVFATVDIGEICHQAGIWDDEVIDRITEETVKLLDEIGYSFVPSSINRFFHCYEIRARAKNIY